MKRVGGDSSAPSCSSACSSTKDGARRTPDAGAGDVQVLSLSTFLGQLDLLSMDDRRPAFSTQHGGLARALRRTSKADRAAEPEYHPPPRLRLLGRLAAALVAVRRLRRPSSGSSTWARAPTCSAITTSTTASRTSRTLVDCRELSVRRDEHGGRAAGRWREASWCPTRCSRPGRVQDRRSSGSPRPERREQDPPGRLRLDGSTEPVAGRQRRPPLRRGRPGRRSSSPLTDLATTGIGIATVFTQAGRSSTSRPGSSRGSTWYSGTTRRVPVASHRSGASSVIEHTWKGC